MLADVFKDALPFVLAVKASGKLQDMHKSARPLLQEYLAEMQKTR